MHIIKPTWVTHKGYSIFSVDLHPDGSKFATAGGDNKVKIWNMAPMLKKEEEDNPNTPKLLCALEAHYGPVNCVRFSPDGRYLASGSDDKLVMVWTQTATGRSRVFGSDEEIHESWRSIATLRGHAADIVDLTWSPDSTKVASCSLDGSIIVWDITKSSMIKKLDGHEGWVKGVAWDPIGRYLASQSDDKSLIIWRTSDWAIETKVTHPFKHSSANTFYRRLSWAPDGSLLTCAQGTNKKTPTAIVLTRGDWTISCDFVGHRLPVICTKFSPRLFDENGKSFFLCCVGSQDGSFSLWSTSSHRPALVGRDMFQQGILDISWSRDGYSLLCCSTDGTVGFYVATKAELGTALPEAELNKQIKKIYGDILNTPSSLALAENPFQYELEKKVQQNQQQQQSNGTAMQITPTNSPQQSTATPNTVKQIVRSLPDGRKRITPMLLSSPLTPPSGLPVPLFSPSPISAANSISAPPTPLSNEFAVPAPKPPVTTSPDDTLGSIELLPPPPDTLKRKSTDIEGESPTVTKKAKSKDKDKERRERKDKEERKKTKSKQKEKRKKDTDETPTKSRALNRSVAKISPPDLQKKLLLQLNIASLGQTSSLSLEAQIEDLPNNQYVSNIVCHGGKLIWEDKVKAHATLLAGCSRFLAVGCSDGSLYIYSPAGRYLFPCIVLGDALVSLEASTTGRLLAITTAGSLHVWDIPNQKSVLQTSLLPLLSVDVTFKRARLSDEGAPLVTMSNFQSFSYHSSLCTWLRVSDDKFKSSEFHSVLQPMQSLGILAELQAQLPPSFPSLTGTNVQARNIETISHLEHQLASALTLQSPKEYKYWHTNYVRRLAMDANESKLRELCSELLGPPVKLSTLRSDQWSPLILGFAKRDLLSETLPVISTNRALQRLANEFRDSLAAVAE